MADLPALPTADIGIVGYWNALDHGATEIDPTEVLVDAAITTYEQFDNGVQGTALSRYGSKNRTVEWRVKSDGWFIVWVDRTAEFALTVSDRNDVDGIWDVVQWAQPDGLPQNFPATRLSAYIDQLKAHLSNAGSITFSAGDVGYYSYQYPNAETMMVMAEDTSGAEGGLSYTTGTTTYFHAAVGAADDFAEAGSTSAAFEGTTVAFSTTNAANWGALDVIAAGLAPDPDTVYTNDVDGIAATLTHFILFTG